MTKYAVIQPATNTVNSVGYCEDVNWVVFKQTQESANPLDKYINISVSPFPEGQGWYECNDGVVRPSAVSKQTLEQTKANLIRQIQRKTDALRFTETFSYDGKTFKKDEKFSHDIGLISALKSQISIDNYPIKIDAVTPFGSFLVLNNETDVVNFTTALLNVHLTAIKENAIEIEKVNNISTIEEAVLYVDDR